MNPLISRLLIGLGILFALFVIGRAMFYAPNGEEELTDVNGVVDSGLVVSGDTQVAQSNTAASAPTGALPSRLEIPKLDIDIHVQHVGLTKTKNMAAPNNLTDAGWYKYGTVPGLKGSAVMAGHVDNALGRPAVFYNLKELELGDDVYVIDKNGKRLHFKVIDKEIYPYNNAPLKRIFNDTSGKYLNLITCQGEWVPEARSARFRLVVYTKLVE